jgi:hypothetical protein
VQDSSNGSMPPISLLTCSMLCSPIIMCISTKIDTGGTGPHLMSRSDNIPFCQTPKPRPNTWNAHYFFWLLLSPYGKVDSTMTNVFAEWKSRGCFANASCSWSHKDLTTLAQGLDDLASLICPTTNLHDPLPHNSAQ